jgi:hypothetical protein
VNDYACDECGETLYYDGDDDGVLRVDESMLVSYDVISFELEMQATSNMSFVGGARIMNRGQRVVSDPLFRRIMYCALNARIIANEFECDVCGNIESSPVIIIDGNGTSLQRRMLDPLDFVAACTETKVSTMKLSKRQFIPTDKVCMMCRTVCSVLIAD